MTQQDDFSIKMDQISYTESIKPVPVSKQQSVMRHKNKNELKQVRSVIDQLGWAAGQTRPDIAFDCCELSRITTSLPLKCGLEQQKDHLPKRRKKLGTS